jgi:hypothetical protein
MPEQPPHGLTPSDPRYIVAWQDSGSRRASNTAHAVDLEDPDLGHRLSMCGEPVWIRLGSPTAPAMAFRTVARQCPRCKRLVDKRRSGSARRNRQAAEPSSDRVVAARIQANLLGRLGRPVPAELAELTAQPATAQSNRSNSP